MKFLVNTTVFVYFSEVSPDFLGKVGASTIREVAGELSHIVGDNEAGEMLQGVEVLKSRRRSSGASEPRWLSDADRALLATAKALGAELVSDDKKLLAAARESGCRCTHTPGFIESLAQKIGKEEALEILEKLLPKYLRRKLVESAVERVSRW